MGLIEDRTEREALASWRSGCPIAAEALLVGNEPYVRAFLRRRLQDGIDDAVQETLLRGISGRERFCRRSSFRTFLLGVARRVAFERYRARYRTTALVAGEEIAADDAPGEDALHRKRAVAAVRGAFPELSSKLRESLQLYYWESLTAREIAGRLGISENTVRSRLRRGRLSLRARVDARAALGPSNGGLTPRATCRPAGAARCARDQVGWAAVGSGP